MTVSPVNFAGNIDQPKQKGGAVKAVASAFVPGLGQFLDGRNKDGAKYLGASVGLGAASTLVSVSMLRKAAQAAEALEEGAETLPKTPVGKFVALGLMGLASTGLWIANIVDAYKGGKNAKADAVVADPAAPVEAQKLNEEA